MAAVKKPAKPKYQVVGDVFVAQTDQGEVRLPLRFKTKLLRSIRDTGDDIDQVFALLDCIGDSRTVAQLDEMDVFDMTELVTEFFKEFGERQKARLGEASASSAS